MLQRVDIAALVAADHCILSLKDNITEIQCFKENSLKQNEYFQYSIFVKTIVNTPKGDYYGKCSGIFEIPFSKLNLEYNTVVSFLKSGDDVGIIWLLDYGLDSTLVSQVTTTTLKIVVTRRVKEYSGDLEKSFHFLLANYTSSKTKPLVKIPETDFYNFFNKQNKKQL